MINGRCTFRNGWIRRSIPKYGRRFDVRLNCPVPCGWHYVVTASWCPRLHVYLTASRFAVNSTLNRRIRCACTYAFCVRIYTFAHVHIHVYVHTCESAYVHRRECTPVACTWHVRAATSNYVSVLLVRSRSCERTNGSGSGWLDGRTRSWIDRPFVW